MGRGRGNSQAPAAAPAARDPFAEMGEIPAGPNWGLPNDIIRISAEQFARETGIDPAIGAHLLRDAGSYQDKLDYIRPGRRFVLAPEQTVPGMNAAGQLISEAIEDGDRIAVFADYDPDGTTAMEAFRLGIAPYLSTPCECADGEVDQGCARCAGTGAVLDEGRLHLGYADAQRGFGLTSDFVRAAHAAGARVLVTLDCGSTQTQQVRLAQELGMRVIVADHHNIDPDNPADHHLNPQLNPVEAERSPNTGAQLAWKLAAAVQIAREGRTRAEHWGRAMYLAGFGCRADMGPTNTMEHRAFFRVPLSGDQPLDAIPPGVRVLAAHLDEDPLTPGGPILTSAVMNLAKRTPRVRAEMVGALLAARNEKEAAPHAAALLEAYAAARPVRRRMSEAARAQVADLPEQRRTARVVIDPEDPEFRDYAGYTGYVASDASRSCKRPVVCFAAKDEDEGRRIYKFSIRSGARLNTRMGKLIDDPRMRELCTISQPDESGERVSAPSIGGHSDVVSGSCYEENISAIADTFEAWAQSHTPRQWERPAWSGPEAYLTERRVGARRLGEIELQARMLGPFSTKDRNRKPQVSVMGTLADLTPDPERPEAYLTGTLDLGSGVRRPITLPAARADEFPPGRAEFVLELGETGPYYLRNWYQER